MINSSALDGVVGRCQSIGNTYVAFLLGGSFYLSVIVGGTFTTIASQAFTVGASAKFWIHLNMSGTTISANIWLDGNAEPGSWMLSGTDTTYTSGQFGFWSSPDVAGTTTLFYSFIATSTPQAYYVATTGSDSNDGSSASPWLTISHAALRVALGDTVHVGPGTYAETLGLNYGGTAVYPTTFISDTLHGAIVISPSTVAAGVALNAPYLIFDSFDTQAPNYTDTHLFPAAIGR